MKSDMVSSMQGALLKRVLSAMVLFPAAILLILSGGVPLICLTLVAYFLINYEFYSLSLPVSKIQALAISIFSMILPISFLVGGWGAYGIALSCVILALFSGAIIYIEILSGELPFDRVLSALCLGCVYTGAIGSQLTIVASNPGGNYKLLWLLLIATASDTGAYFGGRYFGGMALSPKLSPNKTISGAVSGMSAAIAAAISGALILGDWLYPFSVIQAGMLGVIIGVLVQSGDLVESMVKRIYGAKDSGTLVPGHGGLLDRVDGLIFAAPVLHFISATI